MKIINKISMLILAICFLIIVGAKGTTNLTMAHENDEEFYTTAQAMVIMEANSGRIFASKNKDEKLPMASLTKIITAIVAIENTDDLDKKLEIPQQAQGIEGSSIYLRAGEHLSMRELLNGLMLRSGNDAAVAIAMLTSGSVEQFITKCNEFCKSIGMNNTNLVTPNGLHDDNHYTTAQDLAIVTAYALKNQTFAKIVSTKSISIDNEKGKFDHRLLINKNKFLKMIDGANGVKTGYTKKAGRCFVGSMTTEDGMQLVCVLLNCRPMFEECKSLCEQVAENYSMKQFADQNGYTSKIEIGGKTVNAKSNRQILYPMSDDEFEKSQIQVKKLDNLDLPIKQGQKVAELQIFIDKQLILCDNIYSTQTIEDNSYKNALDKVIQNF